jgi:hypothetical protein
MALRPALETLEGRALLATITFVDPIATATGMAGGQTQTQSLPFGNSPIGPSSNLLSCRIGQA